MEAYQFTAWQGDVVQLPNGELGVIYRCDFFVGGNQKRVSVFPFVGAIKRFLGNLLSQYEFYDGEINGLRKVGSLVS